MTGAATAATRIRAPRRVVVTGVGAVAPTGAGWRSVWRALLAGRTRVGPLAGTAYDGLPCRIAGLIPDAELAGWPHWEAGAGADVDAAAAAARRRPLRRSEMSRASALALAAAREAVESAGLSRRALSADGASVGVAIGCGLDGLEDAVEAGCGLRRGGRAGYASVGPHFLTRLLNNMPAGHVALEFGARGPCLAPNTACASGADAVGAAFRLVRDGHAEAMLCGGAEACIGPLALAAFCRIRALATRFNDRPEAASRPFDAARCGFVMAEGAGVLVLETLARAEARGARPLAEVLGYGSSADGHHLTAPDPAGDGARRCMEAALREAAAAASASSSARPLVVGHVSAHATSTPLGDAAEWLAISAAAGAGLLGPGCLVSATKGSLGHLIGAAGAVQAALAALACFDGLVPPTANLERPDLPAAAAAAAGAAAPPRLVSAGPPVAWTASGDCVRRVALSNSFGFGGVNACLCLAEFVT